jgi:hypothetical protein
MNSPLSLLVLLVVGLIAAGCSHDRSNQAEGTTAKPSRFTVNGRSHPVYEYIGDCLKQADIMKGRTPTFDLRGFGPAQTVRIGSLGMSDNEECVVFSAPPEPFKAQCEVTVRVTVEESDTQIVVSRFDRIRRREPGTHSCVHANSTGQLMAVRLSEPVGSRDIIDGNVLRSSPPDPRDHSTS